MTSFGGNALGLEAGDVGLETLGAWGPPQRPHGESVDTTYSPSEASSPSESDASQAFSEDEWYAAGLPAVHGVYDEITTAAMCAWQAPAPTPTWNELCSSLGGAEQAGTGPAMPASASGMGPALVPMPVGMPASGHSWGPGPSEADLDELDGFEFPFPSLDGVYSDVQQHEPTSITLPLPLPLPLWLGQHGAGLFNINVNLKASMQNEMAASAATAATGAMPTPTAAMPAAASTMTTGPLKSLKSKSSKSKIKSKRKNASSNKKKRSATVTQDMAAHGALPVLQALMYMLRAVSTRLELSVAGQRDWEGLRLDLRADRALPQLFEGRLKPAFKNTVKNWLQERRKRVQLDGWKELCAAPDVRRALRENFFPNRLLFGEGFIGPLADYVLQVRAEGKSSPGCMLEWPDKVRDAVVGKMVELHQDEYHTKLHRLHKEHFCRLFAPGEVELAVVGSCECTDCARGWGVAGAATDLGGRRLAWTRRKAALMATVVTAHEHLGDDMYVHLAESEPCLRGWTEADVDYLLHQVHPSKHCPRCTGKTEAVAKRRRRCACADDGVYDLPEDMSFYSQCSLFA